MLVFIFLSLKGSQRVVGHLLTHLQTYYIENPNVGNKADTEDWRSM
jgi:hypothetical protein